MYLGFGLTDYIFNSPKQIILLMMLIGLTQAISKCYEENEPHIIRPIVKEKEKVPQFAQT